MAPDGFIEHCLELLAPLGAPRARRMFGGHGLYVAEVFVAIVADDVLYLKVDSATRPHFEAAGSRPFVYAGKGKDMTLQYWRAPDDAIESPASMLPWARLAMQAALAASTSARKGAAMPRQPQAAAQRHPR